MTVTMQEDGGGDEPVRVPPDGKRGGKWVTLGEEAYRIPPLGFLAVQELQDDVAALSKMGARPTPKQMGVVAKIVHSAMVRNYSKITVEEVGAMLDLGNYQAVLGAVLSIAGFEAAAAGGGAPGEALASSTGTTPTAG